MNRSTVIHFFLFFSLFFFSISVSSKNNFDDSYSTSVSNEPTFGFIENKGQLLDQFGSPNNACLFLYPSDSFNLQLKKTGFSYDVFHFVEQEKKIIEGKEIDGEKKIKFHRVDISFLNSNPNATIKKINETKEILNFYNTQTPVLNVQQYQKIVYENLYQNIDLEFVETDDKKVKYNFIVRAGGDVNDIKLKYNGGNSGFDIKLIKKNVVIKTSQGVLVESIPKSWFQEDENNNINVFYTLSEQNVLSFYTSTPIPSTTLIIDPLTERSWATYYGGANHDGGIYGSRFVHDLTMDDSGAVYFTASTSSLNQIATAGAFQGTLSSGYDAFIAKFYCDGTLAWATYYGGSGSDYGHNLVIDSLFLYVVGTTDSPNGLGTSGSYQPLNAGGTEDLFVAKFDLNGNIIWGTYYGGTGWEYGADIALNDMGELYVAGGTNSSSNIATTGAYQTVFGGVWDSFIVKFTGNGTRVWSTYYGGSVTESWWSTKIATDNVGNVYLSADVWGAATVVASAGSHQSVYGGGSSDAYLAKFDSNGMRIWGTFYGGSANETYGSYEPFGIKTDANQNVYFYGTTNSPDNIATTGSYQPTLSGWTDVFLTKFNSAGVRQWATYYGGADVEAGYGITLDNTGNIYVSGLTGSISNIATAGAYDVSFNGGASDGFFAKLSSNGNLLTASYYGGEQADRVNCIVTDGLAQLYLFGETTSTTNIATVGAHQSTFGGGFSDAFLVKFIDTDNIAIVGEDSVCNNSTHSYVCSVPESANATISWIFPSGTTIISGQNTDSVVVTWGAAGPIIVAVSYPGSCAIAYDTLETILNCPCAGLQINAFQTNDTCNAGNFGAAQVNVTSGSAPYTFLWTPTPGFGQGDSVVTNLNAGIYKVKVTDSQACSDSTFVTINIHPVVQLQTSSDTSVCSGASVSLTTSGALNYTWLPTTGLNNSTGANTVALASNTITYTVTGTDSSNCIGKDSVTIVVNPLPVSLFSVNTVCLGDTTTFINQSSITTGTIDFTWLLGYNGNSDTSTNTVFVYPSCNNYYVTLIAKSDSGCTGIFIDTAIVECTPTASFSASNSCSNELVAFQNNSTGATTYYWDLNTTNNIDTSTAQSLTYTFTAGTYNVQLIAYSNYGCADTANQLINIYALPEANFVLNNICITDTAYFNGISNDTIVNWLWSFGDNEIANGQNTFHLYEAESTFQAVLVVEDNHGCYDTTLNNITVHAQPVANFSVLNVCENDDVNFINQTTLEGNDTIQMYNWNFGNGSYFSGLGNGSTNYDSATIYTVQLIATSSFGCIDSISKQLTVNPTPVLSFEATDTIGCTPLCISFINNSQIANTTSVSYFWTYGDTVPYSSSTYCFANNTSVPLFFDVTLTAVSDSGCTSSLAKPNYIIALPFSISSFVASPTVTDVLEPEIFLTNNSINADTVKLNFGDGLLDYTISNYELPSHSYVDTGIYTISLITVSAYGCSDTSYQTIVVDPSFVIYIPNAFTPNNDGVNDVFACKANFIADFEMLIFDRWGNLIYETAEIDKPWNGTINGGELAMQDVYVYSITVRDIKKNKHKYKGTVTLIR